MEIGLEKERNVGIDAVLKACQACQNVFKQLAEGQIITKSDKTPVTGIILISYNQSKEKFFINWA